MALRHAYPRAAGDLEARTGGKTEEYWLVARVTVAQHRLKPKSAIGWVKQWPAGIG